MQKEAPPERRNTMNEITIYTQAMPLEVKEYQGERFMEVGGTDGKH